MDGTYTSKNTPKMLVQVHGLDRYEHYDLLEGVISDAVHHPGGRFIGEAGHPGDLMDIGAETPLDLAEGLRLLLGKQMFAATQFICV